MILSNRGSSLRIGDIVPELSVIEKNGFMRAEGWTPLADDGRLAMWIRILFRHYS